MDKTSNDFSDESPMLRRRQDRTPSRSLPARVVHAPSGGWQRPVGSPRLRALTTEEELLHKRASEELSARKKRHLSERQAPRLGLEREVSAYVAIRSKLDLVSERELHRLARQTFGPGKRPVLRGEAEEEKLRMLRRWGSIKCEQLKELGQLDAYQITAEDLEECGLGHDCHLLVRILPLSQTLLFRGQVVGRGAQKVVWEARELSLKESQWAREGVEYEAFVDHKAQSGPRTDLYEHMSLTEHLVPLAKRIGCVVRDQRRFDLFYQAFLATGTVLDIDPAVDFGLALQVCRDAAYGLTYLHSVHVSAVHRDVKGANVFVRDRRGYLGDRDEICSRHDVPNLVDSPLYAAPELGARGSRNTPQSDCWSFGVMLWQVFYGRLHLEKERILEECVPGFASKCLNTVTGSLFPKLTELDQETIDRGLVLPPAVNPNTDGRLAVLIRGLLRRAPEERLLMSQVCRELERLQEAYAVELKAYSDAGQRASEPDDQVQSRPVLRRTRSFIQPPNKGSK